MSFYSNVTEQILFNLRNLAEQQKNQEDLRNKNRISKQTHAIKLAETLSPITKKIDKVKETTQKLGKIVKESNPPQLAIENTHDALPIENEQIQPGVINDTSLRNTLNNTKKILFF